MLGRDARAPAAFSSGRRAAPPEWRQTKFEALKTGALSRRTVDNRWHNVIVVLMIPDFDADGNLPVGLHEARWVEFAGRFGLGHHRRRLLAGLYQGCLSPRIAGGLVLYVDGSFVTAKEIPADYDACWDPAGIDFDKLDPVFLDFTKGRLAQKVKYFGEFFSSTANAELLPPYRLFLDFFQIDKDTGKRKGIVQLNLRGLP